jgi:hypothetical protein
MKFFFAFSAFYNVYYKFSVHITYLRLCLACMENITGGDVEVLFQRELLIFIFVVQAQ